MAECKDCVKNVTCVERRYFGGNQKNCERLVVRHNYVKVVHGHWEDGCAVDHTGKEVYKSIDCSVCHDIFKIESHDREYWKNRFKACPFCGAVMDEVDGNG